MVTTLTGLLTVFARIRPVLVMARPILEEETEDGIIKESGSYDELINQKGKFYELVERQRLDTES